MAEQRKPMKRLLAWMAFELLLRSMPTTDVHLAAATMELATALSPSGCSCRYCKENGGEDNDG